jgi:hypothetical protein
LVAPFQRFTFPEILEHEIANTRGSTVSGGHARQACPVRQTGGGRRGSELSGDTRRRAIGEEPKCGEISKFRAGSPSGATV